MTDEDTLWNLKARGQFDPIMDLYEAHLGMRQKGQSIDISKEPPRTQVWRWAAKMMRARQGETDWSDPSKAVEYIKSHLGRTSGQTFLTELSPIPTRRSSDKTWSKWFVDQVSDLDTKIYQRGATLNALLVSAKPKFVICYGISKKRSYEDLFGTNLDPVCPSVYASADSKFLLLPFFGVGQMSRGIVESLLDGKLI